MKKSHRGMSLAEILFSMGIASFIMYAVLGLMASTSLNKQVHGDVLNEWQKKSRIFSTIESRLANAGLGVPRGERVEDIFRLHPSGASLLPGWTDALEVLTVHDIPVLFTNAGGEQVARGHNLRVLSTYSAAPNVRLIPASTEWGPLETRIVSIRKPPDEYFSYHIEPGELSSWITAPSLGRPVIIKSVTAPYVSDSGSVELQNPLLVNMDWQGVDMFHTFRFAYFHVEAETFYIRDSVKKDTIGAVPSTSLHKEPIVDDILSACFELNKTAKTLKCWLLLRSSSPSVKPGIPPGWPVWAVTPSNVSSNKLKVVSHSWRLKNI